MDSVSPASSFQIVVDTPMTDSSSTLQVASSVIASPDVQIPLSSQQPPPDLELVSRGGKDKFIVHPLRDDTSFLIWWEETSYAVLLRQRGKHHKWGESRRNSAWWTHFAEGATFPQGHPRLRCKYCGRLLKHPYIRNTGTTAMRNHLRSTNCSYINSENNSVRGVRELLRQVAVRIPNS